MFSKAFSQLNDGSSDEEINTFFHQFPYVQYSDEYKTCALKSVEYPLLFKRLCSESGVGGLQWLDNNIETSLLYHTIQHWIDLFNDNNSVGSNILFNTLKKFTNSRSYYCTIEKDERSLLYLTVVKALIDHPASKKLCFSFKEKGPQRQWFYELNQETVLHGMVDDQPMLNNLFSRLSLSKTENEIHLSRFVCAWLFNRSIAQKGLYEASFLTTLPLPPKLLLHVSEFHKDKHSSTLAFDIDEALLNRKDYMQVLSVMMAPYESKSSVLNVTMHMEREKHFKQVTGDTLISVLIDRIEENNWNLSFLDTRLKVEEQRFNVLMKCFDRAAKTPFSTLNDAFTTFLLNVEQLSATKEVPLRHGPAPPKELSLDNVFKNLLASKNTDTIVEYQKRRDVLLKQSPSFFVWSKFLDGTNLTVLEKEKSQLIIQKENSSLNCMMDVLCKKMIFKKSIEELENFYDNNSCFKPLVCDSKNRDLFEDLFYQGSRYDLSLTELLQKLSNFCKKNTYVIKDKDVRYAVLNAVSFNEDVSIDELFEEPKYKDLLNAIVLNTTQEMFNTGRFAPTLEPYQPKFDQIILSNALSAIEKEKNQTGPTKRKI